MGWPIYMLDAAIKPDACGIIGKYKAANSCTTGLRHVSKSDFSNPHSSYRAYRCAVDSGTSFHMRTQSHIIDTKAVKAVMAQLPDHWVVRELSERDYGIDLLVEIFAPGLKDAMGKDAFVATGAVFHIQIKGTEKPLKPVGAGTINYSLQKKSLAYMEKFSTPFFLFRVSTKEPQTIFFTWIQGYIKEVMDRETPMWRDQDGDTIVIRIPPANLLSADLNKIENIAFEPKFLEESIEFSEIYSDISNRINAILHSAHDFDQDVAKDLRIRAYRMRRLDVLLTRNDCCIDRESVDDLIAYIGELDTRQGRLDPPPHSDNFELLMDTLLARSDARRHVLENDGLTIY